MSRIEFIAVPKDELERVYDLLYEIYDEDITYGVSDGTTSYGNTLSKEVAECVALLNQRLKHKST